MLDVFDTGLGTPSTLSVQVTWGVKELDRSQIKDWDPTDVGILVWDDKFNVAPPENQQAIFDFCEMLEFESDVVKDGIVECWIKMFDTFVRKETNSELFVPLQNEKDFYDYLFRFIEEDIDGRSQYRTQRLGFINVEPTEEYPYKKRL